MKNRSSSRLYFFFSILSVLSIMMALILLNRPSKPDPLTIGIIIANKDRYEKVAGFKTGMEEMGFLENQHVQYITFNLGNRISEKDFLDTVQDKRIAIVMTTGAWETQMAKKVVPNTPIVFTGIASPENMGLVSDPWISGIDNGQIRLIGKRMELIKYWVPKVKKIMVLADSNAPTTPNALEEVEKSSEKLGVTTEIFYIGSREEIKRTIDQVDPGQYDALLPLPSFLLEDSISDMVPLLVEKKLFTMGSYPEQVKRGLFASYGVSFFEQGKQASRLVAKILDGRIPDTPYEIPDSIKISIHKSHLDQLGIRLSDQQVSLVHQFYEEEDQ